MTPRPPEHVALLNLLVTNVILKPGHTARTPSCWDPTIPYDCTCRCTCVPVYACACTCVACDPCCVRVPVPVCTVCEPACSMASGSQRGPRTRSVDVPTARKRSPDRHRRRHGQPAAVCPSADPAAHTRWDGPARRSPGHARWKNKDTHALWHRLTALRSDSRGTGAGSGRGQNRGSSSRAGAVEGLWVNDPALLAARGCCGDAPSGPGTSGGQRMSCSLANSIQVV